MGPVSGLRPVGMPALPAGCRSIDLLTCTDRLALTDHTDDALMQCSLALRAPSVQTTKPALSGQRAGASSRTVGGAETAVKKAAASGGN